MIEKLIKELNDLTYKAQLEPDNLLYEFEHHKAQDKLYKVLETYRV